MIGFVEARMKTCRIAVIIAFAILVSAAWAPSSAETLPPVLYYEVTDLGLIAPDPNLSDPEDYFPWAQPHGVNNLAEAAGHSSAGELDNNSNPLVVQHGTLWLPEARYGLPQGPNDIAPGNLEFWHRAKDINEFTVLTGYAGTWLGPGTATVARWDGFVWDPVNGMTLFENTIAPGRWVYPAAINNLDQVVGEAKGPTSANKYAFLWDSTNGMMDIGNLGFAYSEAMDINDSGQIVGWSYEVDPWTGIGGPSRAFLYLPEAAYGIEAGMHSIDDWSNSDPSADQDSTGEAMNNLGQVVGWLEHQAVEYDYIHVGLWLPEPAYGLPAGMNHIGSMLGDEYTTFVRDINDAGEIVGKAVIGHDGMGTPIFAAFRWCTGQWHDLNDLLLPADQAVWMLDTATAISENGRIVGWGFVVGDGLNIHAFRLDPVWDDTWIFADDFESGDLSAWTSAVQ